MVIFANPAEIQLLTKAFYSENAHPIL